MIKFELQENKLIKTKIYETVLTDLHISILKEMKETGKYVTKNMKDKDEDLALRDLRLLGMIKLIQDKKHKTETHILFDDITYEL